MFPCNECKTQNIYYACEQSTCEKYQTWKKLKDLPPEYIELAQIGFDSILQTMLEGEKTHPENPIDGWKKVTPLEHLRHAYIHAENAYTGDKGEDHTGHCLTRCAIVKWMERK